MFCCLFKCRCPSKFRFLDQFALFDIKKGHRAYHDAHLSHLEPFLIFGAFELLILFETIRDHLGPVSTSWAHLGPLGMYLIILLTIRNTKNEKTSLISSYKKQMVQMLAVFICVFISQSISFSCENKKQNQ